MTKVRTSAMEDIEAMRITSKTVIKEPFYDPNSKDKKAVTFGKWRVELDGTLNYKDGRYIIDPSQLDDDEADWVIHLFGKDWIDWNEFIPAYFQALKNIGVQEVKMKVFY